MGDILALVRRHWRPLSLLKGTVLFVFTVLSVGLLAVVSGVVWLCRAGSVGSRSLAAGQPAVSSELGTRGRFCRGGSVTGVLENPAGSPVSRF